MSDLKCCSFSSTEGRSAFLTCLAVYSLNAAVIASASGALKKFQLLHHLEAPCTDEEGLLRAAIACGPRKVVIKRPAKGPYLAGIKPSYSIDGKAVRYDCIIPASMKL